MKLNGSSQTAWRSFPVFALFALALVAGRAEAAECEAPNLELSQCTARCDRGDMVGCVNLAVIYTSGIGVERNDVEAFRLLTLACERAEGKTRIHACATLGGMYASGRGTGKDYQQSLRLLGIGCDGGIPNACANLGLHYANGLGVTADQEKANALYLRAARDFQRDCDANRPSSCALLGGLYEFGQGVPRDLSIARSLFEKACRGGWKPACARAAQVPSN
ncbi:sel1 repeat family protein [bacterium]|nr:MAG: sel1 repeat family protein [bacterium]